MQGLEQSSFEFQDMFGASGQIQSAKDWRMCQPKLVSSMSCSISSLGNFQRFIKALLLTDSLRLGICISILCLVLGSNVGSWLGRSSSFCQPASRLPLSNISCYIVGIGLLNFCIRLLDFANEWSRKKKKDILCFTVCVETATPEK